MQIVNLTSQKNCTMIPHTSVQLTAKEEEEKDFQSSAHISFQNNHIRHRTLSWTASLHRGRP